MSKYSAALGLDNKYKPTTTLSASGILAWSVGKAPAAVGGIIADEVAAFAVRKFPDSKYSSQFISGVSVMVAAYGVQLLASSWAPGAAHILEKMTDGMTGRVAPMIWNLFWSALDDWRHPKTKKRPGGGGATPDGRRANAGPEALSLDGDKQAIREVGDLLVTSPETTDLFGELITKIMRREGVQVDAPAQAALVKSMREASQHLADGKF